MKEISQKILTALIASAEESDTDIRDQLLQSFRMLAGKDLTGVLDTIVQHLLGQKPSSSPSPQRHLLLKCVHQIMKAHVTVGTLDHLRVADILKATMIDLMAVSDLKNVVALESCALFVDACDLEPDTGVPMLLEAMIPTSGTTPMFVWRAMTDFASQSPFRFLPFLKDLLKKVVPALQSIRQDSPRTMVARLLGAAGDAVIRLEHHRAGSVRTQHVDPLAPALEPTLGEPNTFTPRAAKCKSLTKDAFCEQNALALVPLLNDWTKVNDIRVRIPVLYAITTMCTMLDDESRVGQFTPIVTLAVNGVRREKPQDLALVAEGCANLCELCTGEEVPPMIMQHADTMLTSITSAVAVIQADKAHAAEQISGPTHTALEHLLRWATNIAATGMDNILTFAGKHFDAKTNVKPDPAFRAALITVIGHVVSRHCLTAQLDPYKDHVIATLKLVMADGDLRVRKALIGTIVAMSTNQKVTFMHQIGAKDLLLYLVRGCCLAPPGSKAEHGTPEAEIREQSKTAIEVLTGTQVHLDEALTWPGIMEHMSLYPKEAELLYALPTVLKCLPTIADRMAESSSYYVDFKINVNMPTPGLLVAVMVANAMLLPPLDAVNADYGYKGILTTFSVMEAVAPLLDEPFMHQHLEEVPTPIGDLWTTRVPELREVVESQQRVLKARAKGATPDEGDEPLSPFEWEEYLTKLITKTVSARPEAEWVESIATGALSIVPSILAMVPDVPETTETANSSHWSVRRDDFMRCALTVAGAAFAKSPRRDLVMNSIDTALDIADPDKASHRWAIARMVSAICTNKDYVDVAMEKMSTTSRPPPEKKGFFKSLLEKKEEKTDTKTRKITERSRVMAALALCHCARRMPVAVLPSRIEATIAPVLQTTLSEAPTFELRCLILEAMLVLDVPLKKISGTPVKARDALLDQVIGIASSALDAANASVGKKMPESTEQYLRTARTAIQLAIILTTSLPGQAVSAESKDKVSTAFAGSLLRCRAVTPAEDEGAGILLDAAVLQVALASPLQPGASPLPPFAMDAALEPFYGAVADRDPIVRDRSLRFLSLVFDRFDERITEAISSEAEAVPTVSFTFGTAAGSLIPRILEPDSKLRTVALHTVYVALRLHAVADPTALAATEGDISGAIATSAGIAEELQAVEERIVTLDLSPSANRVLVNKEITSLNKNVCAALVRAVPAPEQFKPLLDVLVGSAMQDPVMDGVTTSTVVLHGTIRGMGGLLGPSDVQTYVGRIVSAAAIILDRQGDSDDSLLPSLLTSIRNLAKHHKDASFTALVRQNTTPHEPNVIKCMQAVAGDSALQTPLLNFCVDTMLNVPLLNEQDGSLNHAPLSAACCIGWAAQVPKCESALYDMRSTVLCALALYASTVHEKNKAHGNQLVGEATKRFVHGISSDVSRDRFERFGANCFTDSHQAFVAGVSEAVKYWGDEDLHGEDLNTDADREREFQSLADGGAGLQLPPSAPAHTHVTVAEFIVPYAEKPAIAHRRVAVPIIARSLLRHSLGDEALLQCLITALLGRTAADEDATLRCESLTAFGEDGLLVHAAGNEESNAALKPFLGPIVTAVLNNLDDDRVEGIALAAGDVLRDLLLLVKDKTHAQQGASVNIMIKIKPRFDHPSAAVRRSVIRLFGTLLLLGRDGLIDAAHPLQQAHQHLVLLLVHSQEEAEPVRAAAREAASVALWLIAGARPGVDEEKPVVDGVRRLTDREAFQAEENATVCAASGAVFDEPTLSELGNFWVTHFGGRVSDLFSACMNYFEARNPAHKLAAVVVSAGVLKHLSPDDLPRTNAEKLLQAYIKIIKTANNETKVRALRALGWLTTL